MITSDRLKQIQSAHPHLDMEDIRMTLCYFYEMEWAYPDATAFDVEERLTEITNSLIEADADAATSFVNATCKPLK